MSKKYSNFVFFSAGPIGDHVLLIDFANYCFESSGIPSTIILKHPNSFLKELSAPYNDHISYLDFIGVRGIVKMMWLSLRSIFEKNCYILIFPIPAPLYLVIFSYFIRFFTRSRIVGFNLEGTKSFAKGEGYVKFLGKNNVIELLPEMYYKSVNRMLKFLDLNEVDRLPTLKYLYQKGAFEKFSLEENKYIVMHICSSHALRSLPTDRWNIIISEIVKRLPNVKIVFTGAKNDILFIESSIEGLPTDNIVIAAGKTNTQELLTLYDKAKVNVTVQTGNGLIINMLHAPTVVVNIKGTAMFYYDFNENATILFSGKGCVCNPFETECNMVSYKGVDYMACLFNLDDNVIIDSIIKKYNS